MGGGGGGGLGKYPGTLLKGPDVFTSGLQGDPHAKGGCLSENLKGINLGVVNFFKPKKIPF